MSYTLAYKGAEIDDILGRAAPDGALDTAIAAKQDTLTFDAVPTEGSTNPAESGGIYDAIQAGGAAALAAFATDTVSGDVVSFSDGADSIPVKAFTGSIIPQQNLNGQSAPYPAGGGKNKVEGTVRAATTSNGITSQVYANNRLTMSGTATGNGDAYFIFTSPLTLMSGSSYTVSWSGTDNRSRGMNVFLYTGSSFPMYVTAGTGAHSVTFTPSSDITITGIMFRLTVGGTVTAFDCNIQLELGSTASDFAPYSNICPISGWTGANIYRIKMEQGSYSAESGNIDVSTRIRSNGWIKQTGGAITVTLSPSNYEWIVFNADSADGANAASIGGWSNSGATGTVLKQYIKIIVRNKTNPSADITLSEVVVKIEGIDPTVAISFGTTVYAGTLTALGGGLWSIQPTHEIIDLGALSYNYRSAKNCFDATVTGMVDGVAGVVADIKCSTYPAVASLAYSNWQNAQDKSIFASSSEASKIVVRDTAYTSAADFVTAVTGQTLLYPLATLPDPITITGEDLQTLPGANTVWQSCGSVTELTYRADTALYIDKKLGA